MIDNAIPSPEDFRFTEILDCTLPYQIVGYAPGTCPDSLNPYGGYIPPDGWKVTSCTWMPPGSHGVPDGANAILVYCEPIKAYVEPLEDGELTSILYPKPSDHVEITGTAHAMPDGTGFFIEQNYIRYAILGKSLAQYDYYEGEPVIAILKLSPVYEDIIDLDQWGYIAEMVDIRRPSEPEKPYSETIGGKTNNTLLWMGAGAAASLFLVGYLLREGGYLWRHTKQYFK